MPHLHIHVIPRYRGDVPDPRGGIRHVMPGRGNYLAPAGRHVEGERHLVTGGDDPLLPHIISELATANRADIVVSFALESGVDRVFEHFRDLLDRGGHLRILTGDYLGITEPNALMRLLDLEGNIERRVFETETVQGPPAIRPLAARSFHPKAYIFGLDRRVGGEVPRQETKDPNADVILASIQTLSRKEHLERFPPDAFDYLIVDEFHHAAAASYRKLITYFQPEFLLGLTATPERTDGGDLLALCQQNLVYRCDLVEGVREGLLAPFHYYGVPDDVDYTNIPWRSTSFDEEALTTAVATQRRAENALEQLRTKGGKRALGFCVSQRHADFMTAFFRERGIRAVAVHSGPTSAPRAASLEQLEAGELDIVFAVDMFNEGVDLPSKDAQNGMACYAEEGWGPLLPDLRPALNVCDASECRWCRR